MKLPSLTKLTPHRKFNFRARYYDADKEAFEQRISEIKQQIGEQASEAEAIKLRLRKQFLEKRKSRNHNSGFLQNSRIAVIIAILSLLTYLILK